MATNNFKSENPTGIYAVDAECGFTIDDKRRNIIDELQDMGVDVRAQDCQGSDTSLSYSSWCFGMVYGNEKNDSYVTIELSTRAGYYEGANFDYVTTFMVEGQEYKPDELSSAYVWGGDDYKDITKTEVKRLEANARALQRKVVKAYENNTTAIKKIAQFSNGEAVYSKA